MNDVLPSPPESIIVPQNSATLLPLPLPLLASEKTKNIYRLPPIFLPSPRKLVLIQSADDSTADDGLRRNIIPGKGKIANLTTQAMFDVLLANQVANHTAPAKWITSEYCEQPVNPQNDDLPNLNQTLQDLIFRDDVFVARELTMLSYEIVARRIAYGSFLKRNPEAKARGVFGDLVVEVFFKDDSRHDPLVILDPIGGRILKFDQKQTLYRGFLDEEAIPPAVPGKANVIDQLMQAKQLAVQAFQLYETLLCYYEITLVDFKVEVGTNDFGELMLGDVIDADSMRLWRDGDPNARLDKDVYRHSEPLFVDDALQAVFDNYSTVLDVVQKMTTHGV